MAKINKKVSDDSNKLILVNSATYGKHFRAARGSKKPAGLNDVLRIHAEKTGIINKTAKAVYAVLKLYSEGFREGQLWQAMLSRMRKAEDTRFEHLLRSLEGLDLNSRYATERFGDLPTFTIENKKEAVKIKMQLPGSLVLQKKDNCCQYTLIGLLFNAKGVCVHHAAERTVWFKKNESNVIPVLNFRKPASARYFLLCLELNGGKDGVATNTLASRGMAIGECFKLK